jgi:hypothetical protein
LDDAGEVEGERAGAHAVANACECARVHALAPLESAPGALCAALVVDDGPRSVVRRGEQDVRGDGVGRQDIGRHGDESRGELAVGGGRLALEREEEHERRAAVLPDNERAEIDGDDERHGRFRNLSLCAVEQNALNDGEEPVAQGEEDGKPQNLPGGAHKGLVLVLALCSAGGRDEGHHITRRRRHARHNRPVGNERQHRGHGHARTRQQGAEQVRRFSGPQDAPQCVVQVAALLVLPPPRHDRRQRARRRVRARMRKLHARPGQNHIPHHTLPTPRG